MLACGQCTDVPLIRAAPFVFYGLFAFVLWALPFGVAVHVAAWRAGQPLPLRPLRWLLAFMGLLLAAGFVTMGSLMIPAAVIELAWVDALIRAVRKPLPPPESIEPEPLPLARSVNRIFLAVAILLVPLSYLRLYLQER